MGNRYLIRGKTGMEVDGLRWFTLEDGRDIVVRARFIENDPGIPFDHAIVPGWIVKSKGLESFATPYLPPPPSESALRVYWGEAANDPFLILASGTVVDETEPWTTILIDIDQDAYDLAEHEIVNLHITYEAPGEPKRVLVAVRRTTVEAHGMGGGREPSKSPFMIVCKDHAEWRSPAMWSLQNEMPEIRISFPGMAEFLN